MKQSHDSSGVRDKGLTVQMVVAMVEPRKIVVFVTESANFWGIILTIVFSYKNRVYTDLLCFFLAIAMLVISGFFVYILDLQ